MSTTRMSTWRKLVGKSARLKGDERGVAAIEFAIFASLLSVAILNATDIAIYVYQRMEVENVTQMAASAAFKTCTVDKLPATTNCTGMTTAMQNAVSGSSLGDRITLVSGSPTEGYYCLNDKNALQYMHDTTSRPTDCTAAGTPSNQPIDYLTVQATFTYAPLFKGLTVAGTFTTPIVSTAFMRMN